MLQPIKEQRKGATGVPIFLRLHNCGFDAICGFALDPMHNIFIGVIKKLMQLWISDAHKKYTYSLRNVVDQIDQVLKEISRQVPHEFTRGVRGLKISWKHYKGIFSRSFISNFGNQIFLDIKRYY